jgi:predicted dehydrogenase
LLVDADVDKGGDIVSDLKRIGLWGCGSMGNSLARALVATGEACLAAAYDVAPEAVSALADRHEAQAVDSAEALLSVPALDGVIVAVPPYLHASTVVQAAEAGLHVFVEKPMALDVAGCQEMIAAAERHGVKLMVGQVLRYYEPYRSILRWQAEGRFGQVYAASIWRIMDSGRVDGAHWRGRRARSGGYLFEVGAHELDMLRCLMGRPRSVHALSRKVLPREHELLDYIAVQVHFEGGGAATYESGGGSRARQYGFRLYFEGATLVSDAAFDRTALCIYRDGGQAIEPVADEFCSEHPVEAELRGWLAALRDEGPVPIPGAEGMATVALGVAAYRSAETGQVIAL